MTEKINQKSEKMAEKIKQDLEVGIAEKVKAQVEARDSLEAKSLRLGKAQEGYDKKAENLKEKTKALTKEISEALSEGQDVGKKQTSLQTLRQELFGIEDLQKEIEQVAQPEIREKLKLANEDLKLAVEATVAELRKKYEEAMGKDIDHFMQIYLGWTAATKEIYGELRVIGLTAGTVGQVPKVINQTFYRYIQEVGMGFEAKP